MDMSALPAPDTWTGKLLDTALTLGGKIVMGLGAIVIYTAQILKKRLDGHDAELSLLKTNHALMQVSVSQTNRDISEIKENQKIANQDIKEILGKI